MPVSVSIGFRSFSGDLLCGKRRSGYESNRNQFDCVRVCVRRRAAWDVSPQRFPKDHLGDDSKDVVRLGMGLVATMTALVLGLVITSAKSSFHALSDEMTGASSKIILLDRAALALYGPETKEARNQLRSSIAGVLDGMESKKSANSARLRMSTREVDSLYEKIQELLPMDDRQRSIQARALGILISLQDPVDDVQTGIHIHLHANAHYSDLLAHYPLHQLWPLRPSQCDGGHCSVSFRAFRMWRDRAAKTTSAPNL